MSEANLFGETAESRPATARERKQGPAKLLRAARNQVLLTPTDLDGLLPEDHIARGMWELVGKLDLSRFLAAIASREADSGRPSIDPRILVTLWLFATSEGVSSARELARLCQRHDAYRWICGGVPVCPHTLSDGGFRPAWNIQIASDTRSRIISAVGVDNRGSDRGNLDAIVTQIQARTGRTPEEILADGGYVDHEDMVAVANKGVKSYIPLNANKKSVAPPVPRPGDHPPSRSGGSA